MEEEEERDEKPTTSVVGAAASAAVAEHEHVMSEVHLGCPPRHPESHISRFTLRLPPGKDDLTDSHVEDKTSTYQMLKLEEDGDIIVTRRSKTSQYGVTIQHKITSSIPNVGLQVWRGALVLADFVLHTIYTSATFHNVIALELGAGTGFLGILLSQIAKTVFLTDYGEEILDNCTSNVELNSGIFKCSKTSVYIRELDWKKSWPPPMVGKHNSIFQERFLWSSSEIEEAEGASIILAADVIYSNDLTDAFFHTLEKLMSRGSEKVLYLALEKRYNFTIDDLDVVANGYSHFRSYLKDEAECRTLNHMLPCFTGQLLQIEQIPQYVLEYDRGKDLEIWIIKYLSKCI